MTRQKFTDLVFDYTKNTRHAVCEGKTVYRVVGIGRKYARLMDATGEIFPVEFSDISKAW